MDLPELNDLPELTITIGGRSFHFSEIPLGPLANLQAVILRTLRHPVDEIKPHLEGLTPADRAAMLNSARVEARGWPPKIGTAAGTAALLSTEAGQVAALHAGLCVHQPGTTEDEARRLYHQLSKEAAREASRARKAGREPDEDGSAKRIFAVIFGMGDPLADDAEIPLPEVSGPTRDLPIGASSIAQPSNGSA